MFTTKQGVFFNKITIFSVKYWQIYPNLLAIGTQE